MVAQTIHAAGESILHFWKMDEELEYSSICSNDRLCACAHGPHKQYHVEGCGVCMGYGVKPPVIHAVALAAPNEFELEKLDIQLAELEIPHRTIREPDAPWNGQVMVIGIEPVEDRTVLKKILRRFPLLHAGISVG